MVRMLSVSNMLAVNSMLADADRALLLNVANQSIQHGLEHGCVLLLDIQNYPATLQEQRASFITLHLHEQLRGCIGALQATIPLVQDVSDHAYSAAFEDPRFSALTQNEFNGLAIHISVLSSSEPIECDSEADLLNQLRPGIDGLTLRYQHHRGTFLPVVWKSLPQSRDFLRHLKQKAGLSQNFWSEEIHFERYTTESFPE